MRRSGEALVAFVVCGFVAVLCGAAEAPTGAEAAPDRAPDDAQLASLAAILKTPVRDVPFGKVVSVLTGHKVIPVTADDPVHGRLVASLAQAMRWVVSETQKEGLAARRPNEVGNKMEPLVKEGLRQAGLRGDVPKTVAGGRQATGYPDVWVEGPDGLCCYLEVKTYSKRNVNTTQRAFYFSPSVRRSKITCDAPHLLIGFEMKRVAKEEREVYVATSWRLQSLHNLPVRLKYEFNASNRAIYRPEGLLAGEGGEDE